MPRSSRRAASAIRRTASMPTASPYPEAVPEAVEIELVGAGGEPVDLRRTLASHGVADLPPNRLDEEAWTLETTLAPDGRARTVRVSGGRPGHARVEWLDSRTSAAARARLVAGVRHMLRLDEDLSRFYALVAADGDLAWVTRGAGRMLRSPTVFEDLVKTICTTNCTWAATVRMVTALVEHLGIGGRTFPSPAVMAEASDDFYRDVARTGYRGAYLQTIARGVADGTIDLEILDGRSDLPDEEVAMRLLALPGVGPYAAAHAMMLLGRYGRLILDSWTRPTYARIAQYKTVKDSTIERRFRRYKDFAGLAFWLYLTRDWVPDPGT
jgi:3-methyladenine DNA glycosylase/8-oxoguanine DNA glycosylase